MVRLAKPIAALRATYRSSSGLEFIRFLQQALFRDEQILVYCKTLGDVDAAECRPNELVVRKGQLQELAMERGRRVSSPWELQCDVFDGVRDFFVFTEHGKLGHISWIYYRDDPNRFLRLGDRECEIKFCLTFPEFRGRGIYPAALRTIQSYLKEQGYRRCFICVKDDNMGSIRGIEKAGFVKVGSTRLTKVFGVQVTKPLRTRLLGPRAGDRGRAA